jgi:hypothetical protein
MLQRSLLEFKSHKIFWNRYLSWFYVQGKELESLCSRKAIYKRAPESLSNIINLAQLAIQDNDQEVAKEVLGFVLENTKDLQLLVQAHSYLIKMQIQKTKRLSTIALAIDGLLKEYNSYLIFAAHSSSFYSL